jgi:transcriptional regulator with XRE-family HTH domain
MEMNTLLQEMGERINARRKQMRLTQEELAEAAGVTPQTISTAELGKKRLRPENIISICRALDISPDYLLLGSISQDDVSILSQKVAKLTPTQYRHLEDIIDSYIAAVTQNNTEA